MKRNPNGYGTIQRLSGNRARPFAAYTPKRGPRGKAKRECLGYFESAADAMNALSEWNRTRGSKVNYTLEDLYNEWKIKGYESISRSTADCYRAAWKQFESIKTMRVREIRSGHFQQIIDDLRGQASYSSLHNIKLLAGLLEKYAMSYDIIQKNYAEFIELPPKETKEKEIFSESQIKKITEGAKNNILQSRLILILLYTGLRITELLQLKPSDFNRETMTITGGIKTENGKNRTVPIPEEIQPYFLKLVNEGNERIVTRNGSPVTANYFRKFYFKPTLDKLGIHKPDGSDFTPHACRHSYITTLRKNGADPLVIKKLVGHSPTGDVTEKVYTHVDLDMLNQAVQMLKKK